MLTTIFKLSVRGVGAKESLDGAALTFFAYSPLNTCSWNLPLRFGSISIFCPELKC